MTEAHSQEQRRFTRIPFDGSAILRVNDTSLPLELIDLSMKGARAELIDGATLAADTDALLILTLDDSELTIKLHCRTARLQTNQVGLEFVRVDVDTMQHLKRLIELNLDNNEALARFSD